MADSVKEYERLLTLRRLERAGVISDLQTQVVIAIVINGHKICKYIADASYMKDGVKVVEDTKSEMTKKLPVYKLKKKLVKAVHNIDILEV